MRNHSWVGPTSAVCKKRGWFWPSLNSISISILAFVTWFSLLTLFSVSAEPLSWPADRISTFRFPPHHSALTWIEFSICLPFRSLPRIIHSASAPESRGGRKKKFIQLLTVESLPRRFASQFRARDVHFLFKEPLAIKFPFLCAFKSPQHTRNEASIYIADCEKRKKSDNERNEKTFSRFVLCLRAPAFPSRPFDFLTLLLLLHRCLLDSLSGLS